MPPTIPLSGQTIVILVAVWIAISLHTAVSMGRYGRRWWVWFIITLLFTPVPAAVVSYVDYFRRLSRRVERPEVRDGGDAGQERGTGPSRRCRHCGAVLTGPPQRKVAGKTVCPGCGMVVEEDNLA